MLIKQVKYVGVREVHPVYTIITIQPDGIPTLGTGKVMGKNNIFLLAPASVCVLKQYCERASIRTVDSIRYHRV